MNYATAHEHVTEMNRVIRKIKEISRALYQRLPYKTIPKLMVRYGVKDVAKWIDMFPPKVGVSKAYSHIENLTAKPVDYKNISR